jgi:hypothetical protein
MSVDWGRLWDYVYGNRVAIGAGFGLIVSSGIKTMPAPGTPFEFYTWFYDWSHQFLNITNTRLSTVTIVTPPAAKDAVLTPK